MSGLEMRHRTAGHVCGSAAVVAILCLVSCVGLRAQDTTRVEPPVDSLEVDSLDVVSEREDSVDAPEEVRPDMVIRFLPEPRSGISYRDRAVLSPVASTSELFRSDGLLRGLHTYVPASPSTLSWGSSGPGSVRLLYSGQVLERTGSAPLEPSWIPVFRIGDVELLRGVDASLYAGVAARAGVHFIPPTFDVDGSYVRFGYTSSPGGVARVAALYARNIGSDQSLSFNFRRTPGSDINTGNEADIIGGDIAYNYFPDERTRVTLRAEVQERDREEHGGLDLQAGPVYDNLLESARRRSLHLEYVSWFVDPARTAVRSNSGLTPDSTPVDSLYVAPASRAPGYHTPFISTTLYYQHDARYLSGVDSTDRSRAADFIGATTSLTYPVSNNLLLRSHVHGSLMNGGLGTLHAAGLIGYGSGRPVVEFGAGVTGVEGSVQVVALGAAGGDVGPVALRFDGRFYPGEIANSPIASGFPVLDTVSPTRFATRWIVEGRGRVPTGSFHTELEAALRGVESSETDSRMGGDIGLRVWGPIGPFELAAGGAFTSSLGVDELFPMLSAEGSLGYSFDLFRGALDLFAAVNAEARTSSGGFRYDPVHDLWYSDSADRSSPRQLLPYLSALITARVGTAFFSFEVINLLNTEYWTIRQRPYSGTGLRFGLTWGLID